MDALQLQILAQLADVRLARSVAWHWTGAGQDLELGKAVGLYAYHGWSVRLIAKPAPALLFCSVWLRIATWMGLGHTSALSRCKTMGLNHTAVGMYSCQALASRPAWPTEHMPHITASLADGISTVTPCPSWPDQSHCSIYSSKPEYACHMPYMVWSGMYRPFWNSGSTRGS